MKLLGIQMQFITKISFMCVQLFYKWFTILIYKFRERQKNGKPLDIGVGPAAVILKEGNALGLHFVMFIPAIVGQGTVEQQSKWLPRALNLEIIGTYAQVKKRTSQSFYLFFFANNTFC